MRVMSPGIHDSPEPRFLADRMLGPLCRYLRMMGYDTLSAQVFGENGHREDTLLLQVSERECRLLLTRDRELARRAGIHGFHLSCTDVLDQVARLAGEGYITPILRMTRCPLCNTLLREAYAGEVKETPYAPRIPPPGGFFWCPQCSHLYWTGSHGRNLQQRIEEKGIHLCTGVGK